jgi:hypothetical protein
MYCQQQKVITNGFLYKTCLRLLSFYCMHLEGRKVINYEFNSDISDLRSGQKQDRLIEKQSKHSTKT